MGGNDASHIRQDPLFQELVHKRGASCLDVIGRNAGDLFRLYRHHCIRTQGSRHAGTPIGNGVTTVGIPVGLLVIASAFVLTGIYVRRANSEFDPITRQIMEKVK
jgi:uncharacterized membrane protein (DUF485 family)